MTKRRPSNRKPTGVNTSLGNCLAKDRQRARASHIRTKHQDEEQENVAALDLKKKSKEIKSVTEETSLEEFLAKVELAGTDFTAERGDVTIVGQSSSFNVPTQRDLKENLELQKAYASRLKIPRRPPKEQWESGEELTELENKTFLEWRKGVAELQEVDGLVLTPFERNLELWRQLWRVVERSDVVVQVLDARNPLLFRNLDLEAYVKECDVAKHNVLLVNKADLLNEAQIDMWRQWFSENGIDAVFWSALEPKLEPVEEITEAPEAPSSSSESEDEEGQEEKSGGSSSLPPEESKSVEAPTYDGVPFLRDPRDLINYFKTRIRGPSTYEVLGRPVIIGMVGYPNVGKSSTINRMLGQKKVSVSSTPGKTRHLQTLIVDNELTLCDCPGLCMPSFVFNRAEMLLNGILPADQMREYFSPTALLTLRVPRKYFEILYSVMLPKPAEHEPQNRPPTAHELLTTVAFMRGYMSAAGIPDCSRAARLLIKDVVIGKLKWIAAPPGVAQEEFDKLTYPLVSDRPSDTVDNKGLTVLQQLERRNLLVGTGITDRAIDREFFSLTQGTAHVKSASRGLAQGQPASKDGKRHFNKGKKEKLRRTYGDLDA